LLWPSRRTRLLRNNEIDPSCRGLEKGTRQMDYSVQFRPTLLNDCPVTRFFSPPLVVYTYYGEQLVHSKQSYFGD